MRLNPLPLVGFGRGGLEFEGEEVSTGLWMNEDLTDFEEDLEPMSSFGLEDTEKELEDWFAFGRDSEIESSRFEEEAIGEEAILEAAIGEGGTTEFG